MIVSLFKLLLFSLYLLLHVANSEKVPKLILVSFDGFRWDYIDRYETPTFDSLADEGVHAKFGIKTVFVSSTFPSHWTLATGLYAESHGIIYNTFYDPEFKETFKKTNKDPKWWWGEPIWITAKKHGKKVGVYFWPGSEVKGKTPDFWMPYNSNVNPYEQINTTIDWIQNRNVDLVMVYFNQPDKAGHQNGTFSVEVEKKIKFADKLLNYFNKRLESLNYEFNLIVLSDHGMVNVTDTKIILEEHIDLKNDVDMISHTGTLSGIIPKSDKINYVYNKLKNAHPNMTVYLKDDIPERFHYKNNRRISPIIAMPDEGYMIFESVNKSYKVMGNHGYDNKLLSMRPIFFAKGPDFKVNFTTDIFESVNVYPLLCHLLRINPSPNNGSIDNLAHILAPQSVSKLWIIIVVVAGVIITLIVVSLFVYKLKYTKRQNIK